MMRSAFTIAALAAASGATALTPASAAERYETSAGAVMVEEIAAGLEHPWGLAFLPDGALLVTERPGRLVLIRNGVKTSVAGAPEVWARGQGGMLDVVVSPDFAETGQIYLTYSEAAEGGARTAAMRARLALAPTPRLEEQEVIFRQTPVVRGGRHFGSRIVIAEDGTLWITT
ncbi:MAG: PQQ-dependent sugar dehydrogenase, partial [Pseudomonadota bacterium]